MSTFERKVKTIPATIKRYTTEPSTTAPKRRVAGYARVSSDHDDQFTSYKAQIDYYTNYINARSDWEFVDMYTDEGISGTSTKHREGFQRMIRDALNGKIDLIVTKSVSRFARNTVDSLTTIRKLKEKGIEVYFEKENIWTFDGKGELLLTIMSSLAQEESRSISENCTWGQRKRFADGKVSVPFKRFLGYDRGPDGNLVINSEQAPVVKQIFTLFLQGMTFHGIASHLTKLGIPTPTGKSHWNPSCVKSILCNEKYKGDALLQKSYTTDFLTKKLKQNNGEIPQYYVEGNHEAIIPPAVFDMVQQELTRRGTGNKYHSGVHTFSTKIKCGCCGSWYGSKVWHSNSKYKAVVWQCNHKYDNNEACSTPHLTDAKIEAAFISATNKMLSTKDSVIRDAKEMITIVFDTSALEERHAQLSAETELISDMVQHHIKENASRVLNQNEYQERYNSLTQRYDDVKDQLDAVVDELQKLRSQKAEIEAFIKAFETSPAVLTEFSLDAWYSLIDYGTVYPTSEIKFTFKNGQEISA